MKEKDQNIIFIDRDGVINVDPIGDYIKRWEDFTFEEGALAGLTKLSNKGYAIIVISNQAGVGDGVYLEKDLWDINAKMKDIFFKKNIRFKGAYYCLHGKQAGCGCRKPKPGLFELAAKDFKFNVDKTFFVGDKVSDIEAGKAYGLKTAFVRTGHGKLEEAKLSAHLKPDLICNSLKQFADKMPTL
jgi:D-glycero-D-manno-heptose 1,7-bisphosphate phosphatase